jgi:isoleucyl-tRNA synthetase
VQKLDAGLGLALDTTLTEELRREGLARELERHIQDLRKRSGLQVGEWVELYYNTTDTGVESVLLELVDRDKTFVQTITQSLEVETEDEAQVELDGKPLWLGLVRVSA